MSPLTPELEQRAERAVRRGELLVALELFEAVLAQHPEDERVRQRMEAVRALLQPSELVHRRRPEPEANAPQAAEASDAEQGELHAASGRFLEAAEAYRRALASNPDNQLFRERFEELSRLAPPGSRALEDGLAEAPRLEAVRSGEARAAGDAPQRSAVASHVVFNPDDTAPIVARTRATPRPHDAPELRDPDAPLPDDPIAMLRALLERIRARAATRKPAGT